MSKETTFNLPSVTLDEVLLQLTERGKIEWDLATQRAQLIKQAQEIVELRSQTSTHVDPAESHV